MGEDFPHALEERRKSLGISMSEAGRRAGVHRLTWRAWEKGASKPEEYNYVNIERALLWEPGSVAAKMAGGDVVEARPPTPREVIETEVLNATREQLVKTARLIEEVRGPDEAERFLARAFEMRQKRGIEPSGEENRDVS